MYDSMEFFYCISYCILNDDVKWYSNNIMPCSLDVNMVEYRMFKKASLDHSAKTLKIYLSSSAVRDNAVTFAAFNKSINMD